MVNLLRPRKSLGNLSNRDRAFPPSQNMGTPVTPGKKESTEESRWSGENLAPSDAYSGLFASGLGFKVEREGPRMPRKRNEPPHTAFSQTPKKIVGGGAAFGTPHRRRRSSILTSNSNSASPSKYKASSSDQSVDAALDSVMRSLKKIGLTSTTTPSPTKQQSRWSLSSSDTETGSSQPRPSVDSVRSKISGAISIRSRKSEERLRPSMDGLLMDIDEDVPPVPMFAPLPTTPRRLRGLRKLLTPRKRQQAPPTPAPSYPLPHPPTTPSALPQPPAERSLPKKGSFASLRSLAKKGSSTTLRGLFRDEASEPIPCLPHPPTTPSRRSGVRPAKSSIGPPQNRPTTSPSKFLHEMPRRAPTTPRKDGSELGLGDDLSMDATPEMSFSTSTPSTGTGKNGTSTPLVFTPSFVLSDIQTNTRSVGIGSTHSTPSMTPTPLTAKAQKSRSSRPFVAHLLPRGARYHNGMGMSLGTETPPPAPLRGLPPPPPPPLTDSDHRERRYNPAYSIINSYSRPSMGPSNTSQAKKTAPLPPPQTRAQASELESDFVKTHGPGYAGTFGQRSISTIDVDFTASPDDRARSKSATKVVNPDPNPDPQERPISYASSDGVSQEWELEAYLKEVEMRERRANVI